MRPIDFAPCHHRHASGNRCGSPALRGEQFCFFHHPTRNLGVVPPVAFDLPPIADREDAQIALAEIMRRVADTTLDTGRANLLLRCLEMATGYART
jgi:hypothetical protein